MLKEAELIGFAVMFGYSPEVFGFWKMEEGKNSLMEPCCQKQPAEYTETHMIFSKCFQQKLSKIILTK